MFNPISSGVTITPIQSPVSPDLDQPVPSFAQPQVTDVSVSQSISEMSDTESVTAVAEGSESVTAFLETGHLGSDVVSDSSSIDPLTGEAVTPPPPSELSRLIEDFNSKMQDQQGQTVFANSDTSSGDNAQESLNIRL